MIKRALTLVVCVLMVAAAEARPRPKPRPRKPKAKARGSIQRKRIADGVKDGSLTKREAGRLIKEQKKVKSMAQDVTSDGVVTKKEKAILDHAQDKASAHIAKERHDAQGTMGPTAPHHWKAWSPGVNHRQVNQHLRIAQGIKSGSLTPAETRKLIGMESHIRRMERAMKSDGVLTGAERKTLHQALSDASEAIFALKHNGAHKPRIRPALRALIDSDDFDEDDAKELLAQLRRLSQLRRLLAGAPLSAEKRAELEQEYAELSAQLFE